jgi:hypothetical protein
MEDIDINRPCPSWLQAPGMRPDFSKLFFLQTSLKGEKGEKGEKGQTLTGDGGGKLLVYHTLLSHLQASEFIASINASVQRFIESEGLFMGEQLASTQLLRTGQQEVDRWRSIGGRAGGVGGAGGNRFFQRAVLVSSDFSEEGVESIVDRVCCVLNDDFGKLTPQPDLLVVKLKRTLDGTEIVERLMELLFHESRRSSFAAAMGRGSGGSGGSGELTVLVVFHA